MTDEDTIMKLHDVFQVGSVVKRLAKARNDDRKRKDTWIWSVQNHDGIQLVLESILPYLGQRRTAKANELLEYISERKASLGNT